MLAWVLLKQIDLANVIGAILQKLYLMIIKISCLISKKGRAK